uniref:Uncharacterized protein n=1 Tax=Lutzomyia longipalpis TaxID=7200 RepID=A0A1B0CP84_LUTLO
SFFFFFFRLPRRRVALNVRPWLANAQLDRLNYEFKLYKIRNDSCTFENVDELFDCEEPSYANACDFQHDWMPFEENNLQPGLSALLVANIHVMDFSRISMYKFTVYVRYEISQADGRVWELQLMAGEVEITPQIFFRPLFQTELRERKFLYRDFLAIASTSSHQVIHIEGTSEISRRFNCFLMENLKFQRVSLPETFVADASSAPIMDEAMEVSVREDVEMRDDSRFMGTGMFGNQTRPTATFYQQDDFWRGALIRVKEINKFKLMLKVYMRTHNHLAVFVQAIKMDFGIKVEFSQEENPQNICTVLRSLVDEINCKRQVLQMLPECPGNKLRCRKSFEEVLCCELKTNYAFHKLSGK